MRLVNLQMSKRDVFGTSAFQEFLTFVCSEKLISANLKTLNFEIRNFQTLQLLDLWSCVALDFGNFETLKR